MICLICKQAEVEPGWATVMLERGGVTLVLKRVPALVCLDCGEEDVDESAGANLPSRAEALVRACALVDAREYTAA